MEASLARSVHRYFVTGVMVMAASLWMICQADAANFRTRNFIIQADTPSLAQAVGHAAERYRDELAEYWTGGKLPAWPSPCPIRVVSGPSLAAQGVTTYNPAPVRDFQMEVIGTPERILDSVLPHEVTHTVLATYFGRPLPRWADEGICTTVEHESERAKHEAKLREFLASRRGIAMNRLFLLTEYPSDVLPMYAQGYSVCRFLIQQQGPRTFIEFLKDYMQRPSWTANVKKHYDYDSLAELQRYWLSWVESGSGPVTQFVKVNTNTQDPTRPGVNTVAPATAIASMSAQRSQVGANAQASATASNASNSWYDRRDQSLVASATRQAPSVERAPRSEAMPRREQSNVPKWTPPPSVLKSGRYSVATPQSEQIKMLRGDFPARPSRYLR